MAEQKESILDPMSFVRSRIGGVLLIFNFTEDKHGFDGRVDIVISGDENEDIYLSKVELAPKNQGQHLCKLMVTYCLQRAYQIIRQGNEELGLSSLTLDKKQNLTGDVYVSTITKHFTAAKKCYISSFEKIGFVLTAEFGIEYLPDEENAEIISQVLQFTEVDKTADQVNAQLQSQLLVPEFGYQFFKKGGFFFGKKKTRKRRKKKSRKKKKKKQTRKKKDRKWTDTTYPYRNITARDAIKDFLRLRKLAQGDINPRSTTGNAVVDYGTEKARRKTKYRNRSFVELWKNKERREKMLKFAKRLHKLSNPGNIHGAIRSAIDLQWGTVNTMRAAAAIHMYKKYDATRVLDFTAGWGARMVAAMALDIDYIGIDSNKSLKPGYEKIIKLLKPYTKSKVKMYWQEAQTVNLSKVGKYDYVFTSPPYEYLEVYENMTNYEKKGDRIRQPSSSQKIKMEDSAKFYDEFLVPTLKNAYKHLPRNKFICLNMPDIMYDKIKKRWKKVTKCEDYSIVKRTGGPTGKDNRRGKELIFCWKKR
tara:strand:- start:8732 stop:10330 length:1599 start_codon:yes stop_codon:yes gene_type:complete